MEKFDWPFLVKFFLSITFFFFHLYDFNLRHYLINSNLILVGPMTWVKCNTYESAKGNPIIVGSGGIFRDNLTMSLGCFFKNLVFVFSVSGTHPIIKKGSLIGSFHFGYVGNFALYWYGIECFFGDNMIGVGSGWFYFPLRNNISLIAVSGLDGLLNIHYF